MKKIVVLLSILALIAGSCKQAAKKQTETTVENASTIVEDTELIEVQNTNGNSFFDIKKIDSETYFALKEEATIPTTNWETITDFEQAKKMLEGRVIWGIYDEEVGEIVENEKEKVVYKIVFRNGKIYSYEFPEAFFIAYYPQEDILLLEGGHSSDISFNLTTGEETKDVGNPEYIIFSPSKQYRLNAYYEGQECSAYFIQKKIGEHHEKIVQLTSLYEKEKSEFEKKTEIWLCHITNAFWQNDTVLNFITVVPDETGRQEIKLYYQLILKNVVDDAVSTEEAKLHGRSDSINRRVFYLVWEENGAYRISKSQRIFIVDDLVLIEEIPHEPFNYRIKNIEYRGDSVMKITLDARVVAWKYYSELLAGEEIEWYEIDHPEDEYTVTFTKDKSTYIWSYQNADRKLKLIDTYDILPSGHYYANQRTVFHNPNNESFHRQEQSILNGVFDLNEKPHKVEVNTEEYKNMERPYEGSWQMITMTDIGYVVYDHPDWDDEKRHSPDIISVYNKLVTHRQYGQLVDDNFYDEVNVYTKDGSFYFKLVYDYSYSFKWINKEKHIAQWTRYYNEKIIHQGHYISRQYNTFPIIMYDWD